MGGSDQDSERAPSGAKEVGTVARVVNHYENRYLRPGMRDSANLMESEIAKWGERELAELLRVVRAFRIVS